MEVNKGPMHWPFFRLFAEGKPCVYLRMIVRFDNDLTIYLAIRKK